MMTIREDAQKKMLFIQIPEEFEKAKSRENEFEEQMILTCRIKGLLSVKKGWQGEQALYGADIQGCRALSAYDSPLKKLPDLALQLPRIIQNLEDFLLSPDHLLLEADRIFFNDAGEIKLLYLPFYASDVRQQSIQLAADLRPGLYDEKDLFSSRFQRCLVENTVPWEALSRLGREAFHDEKGEGLAATSYDTMAEGDEESFWYGKEEKEKSPLIYESRESRHGTVEEKEWLGDEKKEKTGKEGKDCKKKVKNAREAFEDKAFRRAGKAGTEEAYENQRFDSKADREEKDEVGLGSTRRWVALAAATAALVIVNFFVLRSGILEGSAEKVAALC